MAAAGDEVAVRARSRLGSVLRGKYRLDSVLGVGGMAVVYAATHRNKKRFAVKMLHPELSIHNDLRTRFLREGQLANSVEHPGALAVLDDDVAEDGAAFLVMELLAGETVEAVWERAHRRLSLDAVLGIIHELLDVLDAAHAHGIVHRDIKPANAFVTTEGRVKVLDFGIARVREAASTAATHTGTVLGTPGFMAPEQALGKSSEIDAQTDLWAVGATLFTLASGWLVHEGDNAPQLLVKAATTQARSFAVAMPDAPAVIVQLVDRALAFDKRARWPSAAAMRDGVVAAATHVRGGMASRQALSMLVTNSDWLGLAPTVPSSPTAASAHSAPEVSRRSAPRAMATGHPVIKNVAHGEASRGGRMRKVAAVGAAVAVALAGGVIALRNVRHAAPAVTASAELPAATPPSAAVVVPAAASAPPPVAPAQAEVRPVATWRAVAVDASPDAGAAVRPRGRAAASSRPTPQPAAPATATDTGLESVSRSASSASSPAARSCNPPYEVDSDGNKRWKRECL
jgi:serine/threonine protein kinase